MPLPIYRLRRLLAATAVLFTLVVAGMYFYARLRARNVLKEVPNKIGYDIKQTASGFQYSNSDGKRTLFTIQAGAVKEFKINGRAELHNVSIVLYGRDSSRYDQIYGDDFAYDPQTGDVTARGEVQIDLLANPGGLSRPDQSTPKELKNPIHLKTRDLVFNRDTGNATTDARVEFSTPQATGWAVGAKYAGKSNMLTLSSQIHVVLNGAIAAVLEAKHGVISNELRQIVLEHPHLDRERGMLEADQAVFYLDPDNNVQRVVATGNVIAETHRAAGDRPAQTEQIVETHSHSDQAEFLMTEKRNLLRTAILSGNVHVEQTGAQPVAGDAGRVILEYAGRNQLQEVHALDGARITQKGAAGAQPGMGSGPQDFELTAPIIDFTVAQGHVLDHAETSGAAQITISPRQEPGPACANPGSANVGSANSGSPSAGSSRLSSAQGSSGPRTVVTAGKFFAKFAADRSNTDSGPVRLSTIHGAPDAKIVSSTPGQPDRISTSESVDAIFLPQGGMDAITQQGNVAYTNGQAAEKQMQAWANSGRYTPADRMLVLTGNPRVVNGAMTTSAKIIHINRATGDALAEGDVKSTYSELKEQPNGALLASSSPIHVTAHSMTVHNTPGVALYTGKARLWQDANIIEAPSIQFDRDRRFVAAQGTPAQPVQTILVQTERVQTGQDQTAKPKMQSQKTESESRSGNASMGGGTGPLGRSSPVAITSNRITYADSERKIHYDGGVLAKGADFTATAKTMDAYLLPRSQTQSNDHQSVAGPGQLDRMVAEGDVVVQQPGRRAEGQRLIYTAAEDKFVLTGGPPCIFDAEQGKITGVSLTFFRRDDRVLVEGEAGSPVVTHTRVAPELRR